MFTHPEILSLLALIPMIAAAIAYRQRTRRRRIAKMFNGGTFGSHTPTSQVRLMRMARAGLWLSTLAAIIIALARPVWGISNELIEEQGVALIIALDVSASMNAQDILPSRLERAKLTARDIFRARVGDELGLILFAGDAFVQLPLTSDPDIAVTFLAAAGSDSISRQGTAIEDALRLSLGAFDSSLGTQSIIIVLSDGENHEGSPLEIASQLSDQNIIVHAVGFGDDAGAPIPITDGQGDTIGFKSDQAGNVVISRLEAEVLRSIAQATGGIYQTASSSGIETVNLINALAEVQRVRANKRTQRRPAERFEIFVGLALLALTVEYVFHEHRTN